MHGPALRVAGVWFWGPGSGACSSPFPTGQWFRLLRGMRFRPCQRSHGHVSSGHYAGDGRHPVRAASCGKPHHRPEGQPFHSSSTHRPVAAADFVSIQKSFWALLFLRVPRRFCATLLCDPGSPSLRFVVRLYPDVTVFIPWLFNSAVGTGASPGDHQEV